MSRRTSDGRKNGGRKKRILLLVAMVVVLAVAALVNFTGGTRPVHPVVPDDLRAATQTATQAAVQDSGAATSATHPAAGGPQKSVPGYGNTSPGHAGSALNRSAADNGPFSEKPGRSKTPHGFGAATVARLSPLPNSLTGRNPFLWPGEDRPRLKPEPAAPAPVARKEPPPVKVEVDLSRLPAVPLSMILTQGTTHLAVIGSDVVQVGARFGQEVVTAIAPDHIVLQGPTWRRTVTLPSPAESEAAAARTASTAGIGPDAPPAPGALPDPATAAPEPVESISAPTSPSSLSGQKSRISSADQLAKEALKAFATAPAKASPQKTDNTNKK